MEELSIEFEIKSPILLSTNAMYFHPVRKTKNGRYMSYFCKSESLKKLQAFYDEVLKEKIPDDFIDKLKEYMKLSNTNSLELKLVFGMPINHILDEDASNLIKAIEDCISTRLKIDDNKNSKVSSMKTIYESEDDVKWMLKIRIRSSTFKSYQEV